MQRDGGRQGPRRVIYSAVYASVSRSRACVCAGVHPLLFVCAYGCLC